MQYKKKGAIIRSKARWYNEGEKNSKYFLNLENRHCRRKTIMQIKASNGSYVTNDLDILEECNCFYTVNSLVSDHPWGTTKWSLTGGGRLRERSTK